ncbi:MAG: terminase small subunit [Cetobacterium sp.]
MNEPSSPPAKPIRLTKKLAAFRDAILAGFTPSEAYKKSYNATGMSKKAISVEAGRVLRHPQVSLAIALAVRSVTQPAVFPEPTAHIELTLRRRMDELSYAATFDPIDAFDELNHFKSIRDMPEHVRRCIASFKVDPVSFVLEVKFIDKLSAIMAYSKLAGDIPKEKSVLMAPRPRYDLSKLTDEEFREHMRLRKKAMLESEGHDRA